MQWMQTKRQVAANPQTKPTDLGCESTCRLPSSTPTGKPLNRWQMNRVHWVSLKPHKSTHMFTCQVDAIHLCMWRCDTCTTSKHQYTPCSLPEAPWTRFQLRTFPHFCVAHKHRQFDDYFNLKIHVLNTAFCNTVSITT